MRTRGRYIETPSASRRPGGEHPGGCLQVASCLHVSPSPIASADLLVRRWCTDILTGTFGSPGQEERRTRLARCVLAGPKADAVARGCSIPWWPRDSAQDAAITSKRALLTAFFWPSKLTGYVSAADAERRPAGAAPTLTRETEWARRRRAGCGRNTPVSQGGSSGCRAPDVSLPPLPPPQAEVLLVHLPPSPTAPIAAPYWPISPHWCFIGQ